MISDGLFALKLYGLETAGEELGAGWQRGVGWKRLFHPSWKCPAADPAGGWGWGSGATDL